VFGVVDDRAMTRIAARQGSRTSRTRWKIEPVRNLARPDVRLFLTSATILFVELLLIRWVPANVVYVGYFSNFLLMASFLGIGAGILFGRDARRLPVSPFAPLLFAVVLLVTKVQINVHLGTPGELFFGAIGHAADANFFVLPLIVVLVTVVMAGLAIPLGGLLVSMPPLRAYAIDILGSMAGIVAFTLLSVLGTSPVIWFVAVAGFLGVGGFAAGLTSWSVVTAASMLGVIVLSIGAQVGGEVWSPYYRLVESTNDNGVHTLTANGVPHQDMLPVDLARQQAFYEQIYRWFPDRHFSRVLIIGAGSGTDTALQLAHGVDSIDAVEIDPTILAIGARDHPDKPYSDPRVRSYVDDGRAFLQSNTSNYDLILFALPDSLTLISTSANLRLESYLFTTGAFASVRGHLAPDGIFVLYNYYRDPWLVEKIAGMLQTSFGTPPIVRVASGADGGAAATLADGPGIAALHGAPPPGDAVDVIASSGPTVPVPATDDWPFLYLEVPTIGLYYLVALAAVLLWAVALIARGAQRSGTSFRRFSPHFFVLGVAFLLLETRSLATFSLLFGSTWIVNSLVFVAILGSVLAAIGVNASLRIRDPRPLYVLLVGVLILGFLVPSASLLFDPPWLRYAVASALTFAPVFVANLIFTNSFRDTRTADMAFASNLLGAMVGGSIEYLALITGYQALLLVVAGLYALAYMLVRRVRVLADKDLGVPEGACGTVP
jgi:SAM-dependent methyltransferase